MSKIKRKGPGRPPVDPRIKKIPVAYKLPRWLVEWIRGEDKPASIIIESALCEQHNLNPPC
jgi:hypothetical protein